MCFLLLRLFSNVGKDLEQFDNMDRSRNVLRKSTNDNMSLLKGAHSESSLQWRILLTNRFLCVEEGL